MHLEMEDGLNSKAMNFTLVM